MCQSCLNQSSNSLGREAMVRKTPPKSASLKPNKEIRKVVPDHNESKIILIVGKQSDTKTASMFRFAPQFPLCQGST